MMTAEEIKEMPIYRESYEYAVQNNETDAYRASMQANVACRNAIDKALAKHYDYDSCCLDSKSALADVLDAFGLDRTVYVVANTIQHKEWDGRYSHRNKDWAQSIPILPNQWHGRRDLNLDFLVDRAHPGLVDLFANRLREEYLLTQPLTATEIRQEAQRLLDRLQSAREPNSPNGTHFMAEIDRSFLQRAASKDVTALKKFLPFKSLVLTAVKGREGVFAAIARDENRRQDLKEPRPSVLAKLETPPDGTVTKKRPAKFKEQEL